MEHCLPQYRTFCVRRWSLQVLLQDSGNIADLASSSNVWRYCAYLGAQGPKVFPCGVYGWPPDGKEVNLLVALAAGGEEKKQRECTKTISGLDDVILGVAG